MIVAEKLPGVAMTIAVGEAPLQLIGRQRVDMEAVLVVDTATDEFDNLLRQIWTG